jgi:DtxR family Mn-dependent transcriptional regulator
MRTEAVEDYLKAIYEVERDQGRAATTILAERLGVTPASATGMIKKLADLGLVVHEPYQGVMLTEAGRKIALEVIRHHRLIERFLAETLGVPWDRVHEEAHRIEHVLSEDLEERLDALLGHPATCPHGSPIPSREGVVAETPSIRLGDLEPGRSATVAEVSDHDPALLRYFGGLGLYPGVAVQLVDRAPFGGPLVVRVEGGRKIVRQEAALYIFVVPEEVS